MQLNYRNFIKSNKMTTSSDDVTGGPKPLKVLIAGGGIGGLSAAIFLRQAGHTVEVSHRNMYSIS